MTKAQAEWARVTQFDVGQVLSKDFAVMLQVHFQQPTLPGTTPAPVQTTLPLHLTERQATDLLRLLGHALGLPGTGIPNSPTKPRH